MAGVEIYWNAVMTYYLPSEKWSQDWGFNSASQVVSCIPRSYWKYSQVGWICVSESIGSWSEHFIISFSTVLEMLLSFWFCMSFRFWRTCFCTIQINCYWRLSFWSGFSFTEVNKKLSLTLNNKCVSVPWLSFLSIYFIVKC